MSLLTKALLATALVASFASPVLADPATATLEERNVYLFMDGKMVSIKAGDAAHAMIMKDAKPLKNGTMIYSSGGKLYAVENAKMASGKMMHTEIFGSDFGRPGGW